jgi:CheY-like chemotaxis protein
MSKVLIVDDNEDMRFLLMSTLKNNGFDEVDEASSGAEAVFLAGQDQPNVVILDYKMPGMDGERTAKILKSLAPKVQIVAFSAYLEAAPEWADAYLTKDQMPQLLPLIKSLVPTSDHA